MNDEETYRINLYRLSNEVIEEISKALFFYSKHSITRNPILIERASRDLSYVYTTVDETGTIAEPTMKPSEPPSVTETLAKVNLQNALQAFDQILDKALQNSGEGQCQKLILSIQNNYKSLILKNHRFKIYKMQKLKQKIF
jgi:hypothetical protein